MGNQKHNCGVDLLRVVATFMVVMIHLPHSDSRIWLILGAAVPLFALMAGFFMQLQVSNGREPLQETFVKRVNRLLCPYLFWSFVYWFFNAIVFDVFVKKGFFVCPSVGELVRLLFTGGASAHLWFLICLFYVQILHFLIEFLGLSKNKKVCAGVWSFAACVSLMACLLIKAESSASLTGYVRLYMARLILFYSIGVVLALAKDRLFAKRGLFCRVAGFVVIAGICLLQLGVLKGLILPFILIVPAVFVWVLLLVFNFHPAVYEKVKVLAGASMGIYLIHLLLTSFLVVITSRAGLLPLSTGFALTLGCIAFSGAFLCTLVLRRIPFLRFSVQ